MRGKMRRWFLDRVQNKIKNRGASCGKLGNWMVNRLNREELRNSVIGENIFLSVSRRKVSPLRLWIPIELKPIRDNRRGRS